jgi:gluconokinase
VLGVSIGTSAAARLLVTGPWSDPSGRLFCYALTDDQWVVGGAVSNGGSVLRWIGDLCGELSDDALVDAAAEVPPGAEGLVMLPFLLSERSPLVDENQPGALLGLRSRHGPGHLARAAVEGICLHLAAVVDDLNRVSSVESLRVTGGVFRSTLWRDVLAACVDRPVVVSDGPEGSALGAAALGLVGLGRATTPREGLDLLGGSPCVDDVSYRAGEVSVTAYRALQSRLPELTAAYAVLADTLVPHPSGS